MTTNIRPFQGSDREAVFCLAADTAYFGDPVEAFLEDRRLFCDAFCASYIDLEPATAWVAANGEEVTGFLLGCLNTQAHDRQWRRLCLAKLIQRAVQGYYKVGALTRHYALGLASAYLHNEMTQPDLHAYPAHLHINVATHWRGNGIGSCLMQAYLEQLRSLRLPGVHLTTTSRNEAACHLYVKTGFKLLDSRLTHLWQHWTPGTVENRCYGLVL